MNKNFMIIDGLHEAIGETVEEKPTFTTFKLDYKVADQDLRDILMEIVDVYIADLSGLGAEDVATQIVDNKKTLHMVDLEGTVFDLSKAKIVQTIGMGIQGGVFETIKGVVEFDDIENDAQVICSWILYNQTLGLN